MPSHRGTSWPRSALTWPYTGAAGSSCEDEGFQEVELKKYLVFALPAAAALLALALWLALPVKTIRALMEEAGVVETLTLLAYCAAIAAVCLTLLVARGRASRAAILLVLVFLGAREMDLHMDLTGTSILRLSYFLKGVFSAEKAAALGAVAAVLACIGYLGWRHAAPLWRGLRAGEPLAWLVIVFCATGLCAKALDRSVSILTYDFGLTPTRSIAALVVAMEETLELSLPLLVVLAAVQYLRAKRPALIRKNTARETPPVSEPASRHIPSLSRPGSAPPAAAARGS